MEKMGGELPDVVIMLIFLKIAPTLTTCSKHGTLRIIGSQGQLSKHGKWLHV